jgi:L-lactate dehydrogenase complex protein LldG
MPPPGTPQEHLIQMFTETLRAGGGQTTVATSLRDVLVVAGDGTGAPAWVSSQALAAFPNLEFVLGEGGMGMRQPDEAAAVRDAPLGITAARLAIAETGSVLLHEDDLPGRAVSLMTQRLIVLCPVSALVPSLDDAAPVLREITRSGPSYATFVTGPSRTADIERELAVGVQGPGVLHVVFVPDDA